MYCQDADGYMTGAFGADAPYTPRQNLPEIFMPNGAIYIFTAKSFLASGSIPRTRVVSFAMERERSIDIDTIDELNEAKKYLER